MDPTMIDMIDAIVNVAAVLLFTIMCIISMIRSKQKRSKKSQINRWKGYKKRRNRRMRRQRNDALRGRCRIVCGCVRADWPYLIHRRKKQATKDKKLSWRAIRALKKKLCKAIREDEISKALLNDGVYEEITRAEEKEFKRTQKHIRIISDGSEFPMVVDLYDSVHELKERIASEIGVNKDHFYVTLQQSKVLRDELLLIDYNVGTNSVVEVNARVLGGARRNQDPQLTKHAVPPGGIIKRINKRYDTLFHKDREGKLHPRVCTFCDEFLFSQDDVASVNIKWVKAAKHLLTWHRTGNEGKYRELEEHFQIADPGRYLGVNTAWLKGMLLSPRGRINKKSNHGNSKPQFTCCSKCKYGIEGKKMPMNALSNMNFCGGTPRCLLELTELEVSFLSPVQNHGYCMTYNGGAQKQLKGTLMMMRVKERRVTRAVMQLEALGLTNNVIVLLSGKMTPEQRKKAKEKSTLRTDKLITAVEWLVVNNVRWHHVDLQSVRNELAGTKPIFVDQSTEEESTNAHVERSELFSCYYPDGACNGNTGGFDKPEDFKKFVEDLQKENFNVEFKCNLEKEFVKESDGDLLVNASLKQFPYGICGLDEFREKSDGSQTKHYDLGEYLEHLSRLSDPVFQLPMFQLILYTLKQKRQILRSSCLQVKGSANATLLAHGVNSEDINSAIYQRQGGNRYAGTAASRKLLDGVNAVAKDLPHTNAASKKARATAEAMQHHLGLGSIFLTVTFDDQNSFLMQVLSDSEVDDDTPIENLSDAELRARAKERKGVRINFPGCAAIHFEILLAILVEEVIGWSIKKNKSTAKPGLFGHCEAFSMAVEEQGRKSLHVHMTLWIRGYRALQKQVFFGTLLQKKVAKEAFQNYMEQLFCTDMFQGDKRFLQKAFNHTCSTPWYDRMLPVVISEQELRNLRHRFGFKASKGKFATCPHCIKTWTYEELLSVYLIQGINVVPAVQDDDTGRKAHGEIPKRRLEGMIVQYQKQRDATRIPRAVINARYQHHASCHVEMSCFNCQKDAKKRKKHSCNRNCECRFRLPDRKRAKCLVSEQTKAISWYKFSGEEKQQPIVEFLPERKTYDLFQNVSCTGISHSKFSCNSNVSLISDGPVSQYQFKYQTKMTQADDGKEFKEVSDSIKKLEGAKHEDDRKEAIRLISRASFAHNKTNIVGAPMASYLTRNDSRFYFSMELGFCPLTDVMKLHANQSIQGTLKFSKGMSYFENQALHYLCRPSELAHVSLKTFVEYFFVTYVTKKDKEVLPFLKDTGYFKHPAVGAGGKMVKGVKEREERLYIKISQWQWPDTAEFLGNNIFTCEARLFNNSMEKYAKYVLTLFLPHRHQGDLVDPVPGRYPYLRKLRTIAVEDKTKKEMYEKPVVFTEENEEFLQNLQDGRANGLRYKLTEDDLQRVTVPFDCGDDEPGYHSHSDDDTDDDDHSNTDLPEGAFESYMSALHGDEFDDDEFDTDQDHRNTMMQKFSMRVLRGKGRDRCGLDPNLSDYVEHVAMPQGDSFVKSAASNSRNTSIPNPVYAPRTTHTVSELVRTIFKRATVKRRTDIREGENMDLQDPTGAASNVIQWSKAVFKDDMKQRRAFEIIIASFLLTFFEDPAADDSIVSDDEVRKYRLWANHLHVLRGSDDAQLICLLHGPGGSGKSTVINLVTTYAQEFCESLNHPFTARTIVISAMSGVAATLLHGETTYKAVGIGKKSRSPSEDEREEWSDTRLLIIDEISFAQAYVIEKVESRLRELANNRYEKYGGLNIVFAGDYSQLEPVGGAAIYSGDELPEFHHFINCFIELDGMHRFKDDMPWGRLLRRLRDGTCSVDDIQLINRRCHISMKKPPAGTQIACYFNKERDALNGGIFEEYCHKHRPADGSTIPNAVIVLMDQLKMFTSKKNYAPILSNKAQRYFWENCGEDDCKCPEMEGRIDPVLKLYNKCPMMLTRNIDVRGGQANGSRVRVLEVKLKIGEQGFPMELDSGIWVNTVYASQVDHILLEHVVEDIVPRTFQMKPKEQQFAAKSFFQGELKQVPMKGTQLGVVSNTATTGHKLQGCTVTNIVVNDWKYINNWPYVVLSRVRTMAGLHIRNDLTLDLSKFRPPYRMLQMLDDFRATKTLDDITETQYDTMAQP